MKKLFTLIATVLLSAGMFAQSPQKMSYQAVVRDVSDALVVSTSVGMQISILQGTPTGTAVFVETHTPMTNANGLASLEIGMGTAVTGTMAGIDWSAGPYFIKTETDQTGGTTYTISGTSELLSVPYALFSANGTPGATGATGSIGLTGATGSVGATGSAGAVGATGSTGAVGATGSIGLTGATGGTGSAGAVGATGSIGLTGATGGTGVAGATGAAGTNGATGAAGVMGATGASGSADAWSRIGNSGTVDGTNFIGTTNDIPFNIRVNNQKAGRIESNTWVGNNFINSFWGFQAGNSNVSGYANTANGVASLFSNTLGYANTAHGGYALYSNVAGNNATAIGVNAMQHANNTSTAFINYNVAVGYEALRGSTTPSANTGNFNTSIGYQTLNLNTTGNENSANGVFALFSNTTGNENTANGYAALYSNTTGLQNTAIGDGALFYSTGNRNTCLGNSAGNTAGTTGSNNLFLGYNAQVPVASNSNQVRVGDANITYAGIQVAWSITSDKKWKSNIEDSNLGLDFISKLRPVSYTRNNDDSNKKEYGFIAQELSETLNSNGAADNGIITIDDKGMYSVRYNDLMAPMVKAIQEQQKMILDLKAEIEKLKANQK